MTSFQLVNFPTPQNPAASELTEPVVCSFPSNVPPSLDKMNFNIYEQQQSTTTKKRILKSQSKQIKFQSASFSAETKSKAQGSAYYIGVFDQSKDKCYLLPVSTAYQMQQKIDGFQDKYCAGVNEK
jgi:hypothetical protein